MKAPMRMRAVAVALTLAGCLAVTACTASPGETPAEEELSVALVLPDTTAFPAYAGMEQGARDAAERLGVNLVFRTTSGSFSAQAYQDAIDSTVSGGATILALSPYDEQLFEPVINRLEDEGVQVVSVGPPVGSASASVNTDESGAIAGAMGPFAEAIGEGGTVALLNVPSIAVVQQRVDWAREALEADGLDITAEAPLEGCNTVDGANATQDLLQTHPDLTGIFVPCGPPAIGALQAIEESGKDIVVYSFDGSPDELAAIKDGTLAGAVRQRFEEIGEKVVESLVALAKGETPEDEVVTGFDIVTSDNVDDFLK